MNGVTTNYTLDLNAGLTQVLADSTNVYLYGKGRIAEEALDEWDYYLTDALGSVRQLADASGDVIYAEVYTPFGEVLSSAGVGESSYGFAGEWTDATGMQYLRARYYAPTTGRFVSRDTWTGDGNVPMSYNKWLYGIGNPMSFVDPSGTCHQRISNRDAYLACMGDDQYTNPVEAIGPSPDMGAFPNPDRPPYNGGAVSREEGASYLGKEKEKPGNVTFYPTLDPLASGFPGLPYNQDGAQLTYKSSETGLCGHINILAILHALGVTVSIQEIIEQHLCYWQNSCDLNEAAFVVNEKTKEKRKAGIASYTGPSEIMRIINQVYGDYLTAYGGTTEIYDKSYNKAYWTTWAMMYGAPKNFYADAWQENHPEWSVHIENTIRNWLFNDQLAIANVMMLIGSRDAKNDMGGFLGYYDRVKSDEKSRNVMHWVVITGISNEWDSTDIRSQSNWIRIYNPFDNVTEYYHATHFLGAWNAAGNEVVVVSPNK